MKNKVSKVLLCILCVCGMFYANKSAQTEITDLAFENIEALAGGEGSGNWRCYGYGDIECHGYKVDEKIENYSLNLE